jgi:signal transduction histidine kinase
LPTPARRVAAWFGPAEPRLVPSGAARAADAAVAAVVTMVGLVAAMARYRQVNGENVHPVHAVAIPGPDGGMVILGPTGHMGPTPISLWLVFGVMLTTAPLAFRRVYPISVFLVILAALTRTSDYATAITFAAVIFAAYSAVAYSKFRRLSLLAVLAAAVIVTAVYPNTTPPVPERFTALLVLVPTVSVGIAIRVWRRRAGDSAERLRRAQAEHEAETRRAVEAERGRIAAELHDVVTHNVSVMVVQAGAARRVLDSSPGDAREALLAVEASGRTAMTELRHLLGLLAPSAENEATLLPQPGLGQVRTLVDRIRAAGLPIGLTVAGERPLPPGVDLAAYRVVQEALTNVLKHAGQARADVRIEYLPCELRITVVDDGRLVDGSTGGGRGLIGLRERIAVYHGELDAGPRPGGGWRVAARIPLDLPVQVAAT